MSLKSTFNSDFYVVVATIIPVLYLALTLQGSSLDVMSGWLGKFSLENFDKSRRAEGRYWAAFLVITAAVIMIIDSLLAEISAIDALYNQQSSPSNADFILESVTILIVVVIVVTVTRFLIIYDGTTRKKLNESAERPRFLNQSLRRKPTTSVSVTRRNSRYWRLDVKPF